MSNIASILIPLLAITAVVADISLGVVLYIYIRKLRRDAKKLVQCADDLQAQHRLYKRLTDDIIRTGREIIAQYQNSSNP